MTSPTKAISRAQTAMLLQWMERKQPRAYAGLVRRFAPPSQLADWAGVWGAISSGAGKVVDGVTNFLNSEGGAKLIGAATPFLQTQLEKKQLELNVKRIQQGLPIADYPTGADPAYAYQFNPAASPMANFDWKWIGIGGAGLLALMMLTRRR